VVASIAKIAVLAEYAVREVIRLANIVPVRTVWKSNNVEVDGTASVL
jgi:hypothetical protein